MHLSLSETSNHFHFLLFLVFLYYFIESNTIFAITHCFLLTSLLPSLLSLFHLIGLPRWSPARPISELSQRPTIISTISSLWMWSSGRCTRCRRPSVLTLEQYVLFNVVHFIGFPSFFFSFLSISSSSDIWRFLSPQESENKGYICPTCQRTYSPLDVLSFTDSVDGLFHCEVCDTILEENDNAENVKGSQEQLSR